MKSRAMIHFGNRRRPLGEMDPEEWNRLRPKWKQVHGTKIAEVLKAGQDLGEVDGMWTRQGGQPVGVVTADCVPILLECLDPGAVGAIHAGWRGTLGKIVTSFFQALPSGLADPSRWTARIGPSIRSCCYQVGSDLIERFVDAFPHLPRGSIERTPRMLDLVAVNEAELKRLGVFVLPAHPDCTHCAMKSGEYAYFSYRRGDRDGRQWSLTR